MLSLVKLANMSNPILTTTNRKFDTRVKEPSGVVPPTPGPGSSDRFNIIQTLKYIYEIKVTFVDLCFLIY